MTPDQLVIILFGSAAILFVYWYFFAKKDEAAHVAHGRVSIIVDGGYTPSIIEVKNHKPTTLSILRKDPSDCLEQLIIPQWNIVKALPLNKAIEITFTPDETGEFPFHCGMNMFHGKIIVTD